MLRVLEDALVPVHHFRQASGVWGARLGVVCFVCVMAR